MIPDNHHEMDRDQMMENFRLGKIDKVKQMTKITLDIETLPTENPVIVDEIQSNLKAPGNYKNPDSIAKWIEENKQEAVNKTSFSGLFGRVYCIGYAIDDEEPQYFECVDHLDEKSALGAFSSIFNSYMPGTVEFIGHYINGFDIPFLCQRMIVHGIPPLFSYDQRKWDRNVSDTCEMMAFGNKDHIKLKDLCLALGVDSPKDGIDGSQVYDYYLQERHQEVFDYCKRDVVATRDCYRILTGQKKLVTSSDIPELATG